MAALSLQLFVKRATTQQLTQVNGAAATDCWCIFNLFLEMQDNYKMYGSNKLKDNYKMCG